MTVVSTQGIIFGGLMNGNEKLGLNRIVELPFERGVLTKANALQSLYDCGKTPIITLLFPSVNI
jgi:hypothetical protein